MNNDAPPFALTLEQLNGWSPSSEWADARNVAKVPLARRLPASMLINGKATVAKDVNAKVLYAPDGMNNFANYLDKQPSFNLYNFTHWADIDVLNWFAGTATQTVQIPARPWVETAHKNGVKVIGSVFLAVAQWGGSADTVEQLLAQDEQGRFVMADKLIAIAEYYRFDGWLINQETDLTAVKDAQNQLVKGQTDAERGAALASRMLAFMQYLTANAPQGMEIHWYDAMVGSGKVKWQNQLNEANQAYLQAGVIRSSDAMFLNYWWNEEMALASVERAHALGRSPYDVYIGADLWPERRAQRVFETSQWYQWLFDGNKARGSLAIFAPNFNFNFSGNDKTAAYSTFASDASDGKRFYQAEQRLFSGDDLNVVTTDDAGWPGIASKLAPSTTITSLPFVTTFNVGQGKHWYENGKEISGPWTDMSAQSLLPTWQFGTFATSEQASLSLQFDFDTVYAGGSALRLQGNGDAALVPLFATQLPMTESAELTVVSSGSLSGMALMLTDETGHSWQFAIDSSEEWRQSRFSLAELAGRTIVQIDVVSAPAQHQQAIDGAIGELRITR